MTKKKIEMEVEYPDCELCGECIGEDEQYIELDISGSILTCHRGAYTTRGMGLKDGANFSCAFCKKCATDRKNDKLKQRLMEIVEDMISDASWRE